MPPVRAFFFQFLLFDVTSLVIEAENVELRPYFDHDRIIYLQLCKNQELTKTQKCSLGLTVFV